MSVIDVRESWSETGNLLRKFTVLMNSAADGPVAAAAAPGIPSWRDPHPRNPQALAQRPTARTISPIYFEVDVPYEIVEGAAASAASAPTFRWFSVKSSQPIEFDGKGKPIVTTAGQLLDPPVEISWNDLGVSVSRRVSRFDVNRAMAYLAGGGAVNSDSFRVDGVSIGPGAAHIENFSAEHGADDVTETIEIHFRKDGWKARRLNKGTMYWNVVAQKLMPIIDKGTGLPVAAPVPLNQAGDAELKKGEKPIVLEIEVFPTLPFSPLGLR